MPEWVPETIGQSTARVWRGRGVHRKEGDPAEIAAEGERLEWLRPTGVPCPKIVEHAPGRLVTRTLPGRSAADGDWPPAMLPRIVDGLTDVLRALQALPGGPRRPGRRTSRVDDRPTAGRIARQASVH